MSAKVPTTPKTLRDKCADLNNWKHKTKSYETDLFEKIIYSIINDFINEHKNQTPIK